jgi:hypothetical protein
VKEIAELETQGHYNNKMCHPWRLLLLWILWFPAHLSTPFFWNIYVLYACADALCIRPHFRDALQGLCRRWDYLDLDSKAILLQVRRRLKIRRLLSLFFFFYIMVAHLRRFASPWPIIAATNKQAIDLRAVITELVDGTISAICSITCRAISFQGPVGLWWTHKYKTNNTSYTVVIAFIR